MPRKVRENGEKVYLSLEDAELEELFTLCRYFNKDGSIRYVKVFGDEVMLDAFARNQPVFAAGKSGKQKFVSLHRLIAQRMLGRQLERNELVTTLNGKKGDNRRSNLILTTWSEIASGEREGTRSSTGEKYVYKTGSGRYGVHYDNRHLGTYNSASEAAEAVGVYRRLLEGGMPKDEAHHRMKVRSRNKSRVVIED